MHDIPKLILDITLTACPLQTEVLTGYRTLGEHAEAHSILSVSMTCGLVYDWVFISYILGHAQKDHQLLLA